jgi:hypothetical protein
MRDWRESAGNGHGGPSAPSEKVPAIDSPIGRGRQEVAMLKRLLEEVHVDIGVSEDGEDDGLEQGSRELSENDRRAFRSMLNSLNAGAKLCLTEPQRAWVVGVFERVFDEEVYENLFSRGLVPVGRPVETPAVLRKENLPLKPPGRR